MELDKKHKLGKLQSDFNSKFPNLKIEFYKAAHQIGEGSSDREHLDSNLTLEECGFMIESSFFDIKPEMSVGAFEKEFSEKFDLYVQVFRKSGNLWMQTTSTDDWSLMEQNRKGGASEIHFQEKEK
jgi:hypothetical protein